MSILNFLNVFLYEEAPVKNSNNSINSIMVQDLIDIMNNFKNSEIDVEKGNREKFPLFYNKNEKTNPRIDNVIKEMEKYKNLVGREAIRMFLKILKENGFFQDSRPVLNLIKKYGSQVIDLYVSISNDKDVPDFLKK